MAERLHIGSARHTRRAKKGPRLFAWYLLGQIPDGFMIFAYMRKYVGFVAGYGFAMNMGKSVGHGSDPQ